MGDEYDQTTLYEIPEKLIKNREKMCKKQGREVLGMETEE